MNYVSYRRVSTQKQNDSQLGLIAQQSTIDSYISKCNGTLLKDYVEIQTGTNKKVRPIVLEAIAFAKENRATLVISKLDRLSRSVTFLSTLMDANIDFIALDFPQADRMTLQFMSVIADWEGRRISERVNAALQVLKLRGVKLGPKVKKLTAQDSLPHRLLLNEKKKQNALDFAQKVYPTLKFFKQNGLNNAKIACRMNERGDKTPSGQGKWQSITVERCLKRYELA